MIISKNLTQIMGAEQTTKTQEIQRTYKITGQDAVEILKELTEKGKEYVNMNSVLFPDLKYPVWKKYFKNSIDDSIKIINTHFIDVPYGFYTIKSIQENKKKFDIHLGGIYGLFMGIFKCRQRMNVYYDL